MKFLANENIPFPSIDFLLESGQDIISIARKYPGVTDEEVMQLAIDQNRTIITLDSDYGELIFKMGLNLLPVFCISGLRNINQVK